MYYSKALNRGYMMKPLGSKQHLIKKIGMGASLMLLILVLIAGPMLLFSSINPVGQPNPVSRASLQFFFIFSNNSAGTQLQVPLFETTQLTKNATLTQSEFDLMEFNYPTSSSDDYSPE